MIGQHALSLRKKACSTWSRGTKKNARWRIKLTARGLDFLEDRLDEILASPDLVE
jgi:hypothetical protein